MTDGDDGGDDGGDSPFVFIIVGAVRRSADTGTTRFNALLSAPDDDSAVRRCLEALAAEGYDEAELDQIGEITEPPKEDPFAEPYETALAGEIALIVFDDEDD